MLGHDVMMCAARKSTREYICCVFRPANSERLTLYWSKSCDSTLKQVFSSFSLHYYLTVHLHITILLKAQLHITIFFKLMAFILPSFWRRTFILLSYCGQEIILPANRRGGFNFIVKDLDRFKGLHLFMLWIKS